MNGKREHRKCKRKRNREEEAQKMKESIRNINTKIGMKIGKKHTKMMQVAICEKKIKREEEWKSLEGTGAREKEAEEKERQK